MLIFEIYDAENPLWVMKSWQNFAKNKCHQKVAAQNGFGTDSDIFMENLNLIFVLTDILSYCRLSLLAAFFVKFHSFFI